MMDMELAPIKWEWTISRVARLKDLWAQGLSGTQIRDELSLQRIPDELAPTRCAILGKVHRLRLPCRESPTKCRAPRRPRPTRNGGSVISALKAMERALPVIPFRPREPDPVEPVPSVAFCDLGYGDCKYFSAEAAYDVMCCGAPAIVGTSWCIFHSRIVYQKAKSPEQRQAELDSAARARAGKEKKAKAA